MPGIVWPAVPVGQDAATLALLAQLEMSQWWSPEVLLHRQLEQATELLRFSARTVPFYRDRLAALAEGTGALTMDDWRSIPILHRAEVQEAGDALATQRPIKGHGAWHDVTTSGSTGEPVVVQWNAVTHQFHTAITLRDHIWHRRNFSAKVGLARRQSEKTLDAMKAGKSARWATSYRSGPMVFFELADSVDDALNWMAKEEPDYLITYPGYLRAMIQQSERSGIKPSRLREVMTFGGIVPDDLRTLSATRWGAKLVDMYSTQEVGIMALECPNHEHLHVQSESVLLEVLDEKGDPCAPGEVGRIIATPLHNFATPLIRYFVGDYAEVGHPCDSGRGLPVLRKIYGRARNMMTLPNGEKIWVAVNDSGFYAIEPLRQFQIVQAADLTVKLKLVVDRPLTPEEEAVARNAVRSATGYDFDVQLDYVDAMPSVLGGKLEDVVSEVVD